MKITFWVYAPSFEDEHGSSGAFAGFCGNKNVHGICACHYDCIAIDVVELNTWNEARRHANYLANHCPDDGITDPDDPLEQSVITEAEGSVLSSADSGGGGEAA